MTQMVEVTPASELFRSRQFNQAIIVRCVRWYLSYKLSFHYLMEMMSERGITVVHTTILRGHNDMYRNSRRAGTVMLVWLAARSAVTKPV